MEPRRPGEHQADRVSCTRGRVPAWPPHWQHRGSAKQMGVLKALTPQAGAGSPVWGQTCQGVGKGLTYAGNSRGWPRGSRWRGWLPCSCLWLVETCARGVGSPSGHPLPLGKSLPSPVEPPPGPLGTVPCAPGQEATPGLFTGRGGAPELPGAIARRGGQLQPARTGREGGTKALCARGNRPRVRERPARRRPMASEPRVSAPEPCSRPAPGPRPQPRVRARPEPPPGPLVPLPAGRCVRPAAARPHSGTHLGGDPSRASAHDHGGGDGGARSRNPFAADTAGDRSTTAKRGCASAGTPV